MVRKALFTHFPAAERETEAGHKPFTTSHNNLVTELLTDAQISKSFIPTPLACNIAPLGF